MEEIVAACAAEVALSIEHASTVTELGGTSTPTLLIERGIELVSSCEVIACTHEVVLFERDLSVMIGVHAPGI